MRHKPHQLRAIAVRQVLPLVGIVLVLAASFASLANRPVHVAAATTSTVNFQARLENNSGSIAADGDYNVEFKIYNTASSGGTAQGVCTGACQWVETRTSTNKVHVVNGYLTVSLGDITAFSGSMPWDQELWITMNIGGTGSPSWDGEMSPRLKLTAVPYAFQAAQASKLQVSTGGNTATLQFASVGQATTITLPDPGVSGVGTVCYQGSASCGFATGTGGSYIQNGTSVQTAANFNIRSAAIGSVGGVIQGANGQTADLLQLQSWNGTTATNVFAVSPTGVLTMNGGQTIDITTATAATANGLTLAPGISSGATTTGGGLSLKGGDVSGTTTVTGGAVTIQGGNATGGSGTRNGGAVTLDGGTGGTAATNGIVNIGTTNSPTINIGSVGSTAKATAIHIGDTTTTTAGAIQSITVGSNSNLAHTTVIQGGSGNGAGTEAIRLVPQTTGGIAIGSTTGTGTITLGQSTAANTINIGSANFTAANTQTINVANGTQLTAASTLNVNILSNTGNNTFGADRLNLGNSDRVTQIDIGNVAGTGASSADAARTLNLFTGAAGVVDTINVGTGAATVAGGKTIHIGDGTPTGSGTNLITIGSIAALANTTTIQGGNGSGAVSVQAAASGTISVGTTNANVVNVGSTAATTTTIRGGSGVNVGDGGTTGAIQIGNTTGGVAQTISIGTNATASATNTINVGSGTTSSGTVTVNAGTGAGNLILLQSNNSTGGVKVKSATNSTAAFLVQDSGSNSYLGVDTSGAAISVGYASSTTTLNGTVKVATLGTSTVNSTIVCRDSVTNILTDCGTGGGAGTPFIQGGNSFGATGVLGTNDTQNLQFETNNIVRATFDQSNGLYLGNGVTAAAPSNFTVAGTGSSTAGTAGANLTLQGGAGATTGTGSVGGALKLVGGNAGGSSNNNGGDVLIQGGAPINTGSGGQVVVRNQGDTTGAFQVQASGGGTPIFNIDTVNSRVGVGGVASTSKFEVLGGDAAIYNSGSNPKLILGDSTTAGQNGYLQWDSAGDYFKIETAGTNGVKIKDNFVSIGNIAPSQPLIVGSGTTNLFQIDTNGVETLIGGQTADITTATAATAANLTLQPGISSGASATGASSTIKGGDVSGTTSVTGGVVTIQGGNATGGSGTRNGGNISIDAGTGATANGSISVGTANAVTLTLGRAAGTTVLNGTARVTTLGAVVTATSQVVCRDTATGNLTACDSGSGGLPFVQGGNSFGALATLGTNDANNLAFETNNITRATFDQSNGLYLGNGITAATPNNFTLAGTGSSTAGTAGAQLSLQGGAGASATTGSAGGALSLSGGNAGGSGNNAGGNVILLGGARTGTGAAGSVIARPQTDTANAFMVQNASSSPVLQVDTVNNRMGINVSGNPVSTLQVTGTLRIDGTVTESYVTPGVSPQSVPTKINIPSFDPGNFGQIVAMGLPSTAINTARVMSLFDARTSAHQPTLAVLSPDENNIVGLSWNGTSTTGLLMTTDSGGGGNTTAIGVRSGATSGGGNSGTLMLQSGDIAGGSGNTTGAVFLVSGTGTGTNASSGNVTIDSGSKTGTGTNGTISIGAAQSTSLLLGRAAGTTVLNGTARVTTLGAVVTATSQVVCRDTATGNLTACDSGSGGLPFVQGGNSFGALATLGTNDTNNLALETNNVTRALFDQSNNLYLGLGATAAAPTAFTVQGTGSATAGTAGAQLSIKGGAGATTTTGSVGGVLALAGGAAGGSGNNNGGNLTIDGGAGVNSGVRGSVILQGTSGSVGIGVTPNVAYKLDVAGDINISTGSVYRINGADINTAGTLTNVAYVNKANTFTLVNTFSRNGTGTGDYSLGVTGTPINDATSSLVRVGGAIAGGNAVANGGTYIGLNTPAAGAGSAADFFDFQANGTIRAQLTNAGNLTVGGTYNTNTFTSSSLQFGAGSAASVQAAAGQALNVTGHASSTFSTDGGDLSVQAAVNLNLGNGGGTAINIGTNNAAHTIGIGNTGATGTQTITVGGTGNTANTVVIQGGTTATGVGAVSIQSASAGLITIGTTNSNPVTIGGATSTVTAVGTFKLTTALGAATANANAVCRDSATTALISCDANTTGRPFLQGGNSFGGGTSTLGTNDSNVLAVTTNSVVRATFDTSNNLYLGLGATAAAPTAFTVQTTSSSAATVAGAALTVKGGTGNTTGAGGAVTIQGGAGGATGTGGVLALQGGAAGGGNTNGANVTITAGAGAGTGSRGVVVLGTPVFQTATVQNCVSTPCAIDTTNANNNSALLITTNASGYTATLSDPALTTAGRVLYITNSGANDFTLSINGGGTGNTITMKPNTTATMIWNGVDWTAAGASSSTDLQAAYDNTASAAGAAELVVSNTANANGLTIRDSSTNPVNGTLLEVQSSTAANLFSVNSNVTDYAADAGAETAGGTSTTFPANTWSAVGSASTSRYITAGGFIATGIASVSTTTTNVTNDGVKNQLSAALTANNHYNVSFATRLAANQTFTSLQVYYSIDGTAASVQCTTGKSVATSVWTKVNCAFTAPSSGITSSNAIIIRQATAAIRTFYVDNLSVTIAADFNLATDGSVDDAGNFATNWVTAGQGTVAVTRSTTDGNDASDSAKADVTAGAANAGLRNKLSINPLVNTLYRVSVYAKLNSGAAFTDFKVRYSATGSTASGSSGYVDCTDYNTQTVVTTGWTQITCYISTDATGVTTPYVYFAETASGVRNFSVDTFSITLAQNTSPNVQIGGGLNGGPVTLFTLDRGASAPIAANNDSMLGSMYYDTTLGKLQCYEADGWGACGSSPDNIVTISPEYTNAVLHGTGVGTMTSDLCSDGLNVNDGSSGQPTICGSNETFNFYKWTSPQATAQTYSIYVTYQLPTTFKTFQSGTTSIMGRTDSSSSTVQYSVYRNSGAGLTQCGSTVPVSTGSVSSWQPGPASGAADPSTCGFVGGNSIVFKIDVIASVNANAYVGNLGFTYTNQ